MLSFRWRARTQDLNSNALKVNKDSVHLEGCSPSTDLVNSSSYNKLNNNDQIKEYVEKLHMSNPGMDPDTMAKLLAQKFNQDQKKSRAWYRVNETRKFTGGEKISTQKNEIDTKVSFSAWIFKPREKRYR